MFLSLCIKLFRYLHRVHVGSVFPVPVSAGSSSLTISPLSPYISSRLQPLLRLVVGKQAVSRSLASVSARMYRKIYTRQGLREEVREQGESRVRGWDGRVGDVAEARAVFEKGEPRHISLQTNNFWIFISCFSLPACVPVSKANATLTTYSIFCLGCQLLRVPTTPSLIVHSYFHSSTRLIDDLSSWKIWRMFSEFRFVLHLGSVRNLLLKGPNRKPKYYKTVNFLFYYMIFWEKLDLLKNPNTRWSLIFHESKMIGFVWDELKEARNSPSSKREKQNSLKAREKREAVVMVTMN